MNKTENKLVASNKRARHEYFIEEIYEAGIVLSGTEVKSIRLGKSSIKESYCFIKNNEVYIFGMHISPYENGNIYNVDPLRTRKLLLNKREILKLSKAVQMDGYALVPLSVNIRKGLVKVDIALAKGKKLYDKRQTEKEKTDKRKIEKALKAYN